MLKSFRLVLVGMTFFALAGFTADTQSVDWNSWNKGYKGHR